MDDSMDLNGFDIPTRVLPAQYSKTEALVGVGQKDLRRVSVPTNTQLSLHLIIIDYLHSVKFKKLATGTRKGTVDAIKLFFQFIEYNHYINDSDVPNKVFEEFVQYIKTNTGKKGNSVGMVVSLIKVSLDWYLKNKDKTTEKNNYSNLVRLYMAHIPSFQKSPSTPFPSLAALFGTNNCPYSDTEIIKSLRLVCCWLLLEYDRQRNILLDDPVISDAIRLLKQRDLALPPMSYGNVSTNGSEGDESRRLYLLIVNAVINSNDSVLTERIMPFIQCDGATPLGVMPLSEMQFFLGKIISKSGEKLIKDFKYKKKRYRSRSISTLTFRDLLAPSVVEVFAAQCFMASERAQTSNLDRLKLSDVADNDRGIQTQHFKGRRPKKQQMNLTGVYPPNQLIHDSLSSYFNIVESCQPLISKEDRGLALPYIYPTNLKSGYLGKTEGSLSIAFELLVTNGSYVQKSLFESITEKEAEPFLWIVKKIIDQNQLVNEQDREWNILRHKNTKHGKSQIIRGNIVTHKRTSLTPTFIGQSRVAMDGGVEIQEKGTGESLGFSDSKVEAQLTAHTPGTKHNVYHDRSNAKEVIKSRRSFAVQMGELMKEDALKMGELMKNTQIVDFEEAKKLLGCANASEDFKSLINELDEDIGLTSEIITDDKTIFVANELTAALIILKMSHIEQNLPRMLMDDPDSQTKAKRVIGEKVYLQAVLDRFPEDIQVAGKAMSKNLTFSFSDLI